MRLPSRLSTGIGAGIVGVLTGVLGAQGTVTSPRGLDTTEGNSALFLFGVNDDGRLQQIDASQIGHPMTVHSLAFRCDGPGPGGMWWAVARTADLEVTFGECDPAVVTSRFDRNYAAGTRQTVFTRKPVSMPFWPSPMGASTRPFDVVVSFDSAFQYGGQRALVIELRWQNVQQAGGGPSPYVDAEHRLPGSQHGLALGRGCIPSTGGGVFLHSLTAENGGAGADPLGMRLRVTGGPAPRFTGVILNVDAQNPDLLIPGLCTRIHASPLLSFPIGSSLNDGTLPEVCLSYRHNAALVNVVFYSQLLALDPGQPLLPLALSNGASAMMPGYGQQSIATVYLLRTQAPEVDTPPVFGSAVVFQLGM
ncbi:MAG: hypothetical protein IPM29_28545 [Planctomycetes bacterium]|nr:hypothetical protein [Planctomycetota bacterium]